MEIWTVGNATRLNLAAIRRNRGLTLYEIADRTKISIPYLRAIEDEQFDALPGMIYSISYIRQYAKAIDYDADSILLVFRETSAGGFPEEHSVHANDVVARPAERWERCWRAITGLLAAGTGQG